MQRLEAQSANMKIPVRDKTPTEFEVQAYLYNKLLKRGVDVRGEIAFRDKSRRSYRFDLVIYESAEPKEIVEVKALPVKHRNGVENTRQAKRYRQFGVSVVFVYGMIDADYYLANSVG